MLSKKTVLTANSLNSAFISKSDTSSQSLASSLTLSGGSLTLKNSVITDNAGATYLRIDPQGNQVIIYDGVNNQRLDVYSSSGSESTYIQTINGAKSFGQIDVATAVDHLELMTNSNKKIVVGGNIVISGNGRELRFVASTEDTDNTSAIVFDEGAGNENFRLQFDGAGGTGSGRIMLNPLGDIGISLTRDAKFGIGTSDPLYKLDVRGDIRTTGKVLVGVDGITFPNDAFGGSGDTASIFLRKWQGTEDQELVISIQNDANDRINIITNSNSGLKVNGNTVWNSGNHGGSSGLDSDMVDGKHYTDITGYTDTQITTLTNRTYVSEVAPTGTIKIGDQWFISSSATFNIWDGSVWKELSVNNPRGTVNFSTNDARLVIPVGVDKYAT